MAYLTNWHARFSTPSPRHSLLDAASTALAKRERISNPTTSRWGQRYVRHEFYTLNTNVVSSSSLPSSSTPPAPSRLNPASALQCFGSATLDVVLFGPSGESSESPSLLPSSSSSLPPIFAIRSRRYGERQMVNAIQRLTAVLGFTFLPCQFLQTGRWLFYQPFSCGISR